MAILKNNKETKTIHHKIKELEENSFYILDELKKLEHSQNEVFASHSKEIKFEQFYVILQNVLLFHL